MFRPQHVRIRAGLPCSLAAADYWLVLTLSFCSTRTRRIALAPPIIALLAFASAACGRGADAARGRKTDHARDTVVVFLAASLARPFQVVLDTFAVRTGAVIQRESGASLEHARKITELHRIPDLIALADREVFQQLLMPAHISWYGEFATNRMVIAYTARSRHAGNVDSTNWTKILSGDDVQVGRPDPDLAPAGYRAILTLRLAERYYRAPGLADRLLHNAPRRNMRSNAAELAVLLQLGELDYIYDYESVAESNGFRYVRLPRAIDLSDPSLARVYAEVSVRVHGAAGLGRAPGRDSVTFTGQPIIFALGVPRAAPHMLAGRRLAAFLLSVEGRRMLRAAHLNVLDPPVLVGDSIPSDVRASVGR